MKQGAHSLTVNSGQNRLIPRWISSEPSAHATQDWGEALIP